ncbi:MAG TPA: acyltransferase family protein, partial [Patescibacteria group bacterium]|nr:acyltransferase family protein [Patescibacteria group bacterium]
MGFLYFWLMPLLFLISGAVSNFSIETSPSKKDFLGKRIKRLLLPLILGLGILNPVQSYYSSLNHDMFNGSFWAYYPQYFKNLQFPTQLNQIADLVSHLWFLVVLLIFTFMSFPLFKFLKSPKGQNINDQISRLLQKKYGFILLSVPIILVRAFVQALYPGHGSLGNFLMWFLFLVFGY